MPKNVLVVAATENELPKFNFQSVSKLVTGVGMVATTFSLTKELTKKSYDLVVNVGIAGSFAETPLGEVVQVVSDSIVELGVEDNAVFVPAHKLDLCEASDMQFHTDARIPELKSVAGITVNRVHGSRESIEKVVHQFNPDIETMEGAAVAYVCQNVDVPWVQIRSISNKVEPRNRDAWNIPLALNNLDEVVVRYLNNLLNEA